MGVCIIIGFILLNALAIGIFYSIFAAACGNSKPMHGKISASCDKRDTRFKQNGVVRGTVIKKRSFTVFVTAFLAVLTTMPLLALLPFPAPLQFHLLRFSNIWLGLWMFFCLFLLIALAVLAVLRHSSFHHRHAAKRGVPVSTGRAFSMRFARLLLLGALLFTLILNLSGYHNAYTVRATPVSIETRDKVPAPLKIALLADLHISSNSSLSHIQKAVSIVNEFDPDFVIIAGDLFSDGTEPIGTEERQTAFTEALKELHSRYGNFLVWGNHDVRRTTLCGFSLTNKKNSVRDASMDAFAQACGLIPLEDEERIFQFTSSGSGASVPLLAPAYPSAEDVALSDEERQKTARYLRLIGRPDAQNNGSGEKERACAEQLLSMESSPQTPANTFTVVLDHEPNDLAALSEAGADLVLSGHTHAGQIFPGNLFTALFNDQVYGVKSFGNCISVVTSGVGFFGPPLRLGTSGEVMLITVQ